MKSQTRTQILNEKFEAQFGAKAMAHLSIYARGLIRKGFFAGAKAERALAKPKQGVSNG